MTLGERLRQARLEAGLSQRQLCEAIVTRNMLSQIENGSAKPSMQTLGQLASRLGKPMAYFLEETVASPNRSAMTLAGQQYAEKDYRGTLDALKNWQGEDEVLDTQRWLLTELACLRLARQVLDRQQPGYAAELVKQAAQAAAQNPYAPEELERTRLLLLHEIRPGNALELAGQLPELLPEILLRAQAALDAGDPRHCGCLLEGLAPCDDPRWHYLRGEAYRLEGDYARAIPHYTAAEAAFPQKAAQQLEVCCRELEDYKMAYQYACKLRELEDTQVGNIL